MRAFARFPSAKRMSIVAANSGMQPTRKNPRAADAACSRVRITMKAPGRMAGKE